MKKFLTTSFAVLLLSGLAFANLQTNTTTLADGNEKIVRGKPLSNKAKKVDLSKALEDVSKLDGETVEISGEVVRNCQSAGCWAEIGDKATGKSVRATFGDHQFFVPLKSAGSAIRAEGKFVTYLLAKEDVDARIEKGAKFDNRNEDGTVTVITFEATGVELVPAK